MLFHKLNKLLRFRNSKAKPLAGNKQTLNLSAQSALLLITCQFLNLMTLSFELSWWMLAIITICLGWQLAITKNLTKKPNKVLVSVLSITGCVLLWLTSSSLGLLSTMLHLLCLSYVLKSFELNKRSDFYQIFLLGLFILVASLIFKQSLYFAIILLFIMIVNFTLIITYFAPSEKYMSKLSITLKIFMQSAPLAICLFFVFPKLTPLWALPTVKSAKTGLSDSVKVGDIANLALSDELAFRVKFDNKVPPYSQMYWRTIVMENFDGQSWKRSHKLNRDSNQYDFELAKAQGEQLNYQVITSPSYQHWLYGLDLARVNNTNTLSGKIFHRQDYSLYSNESITQNSSYKVTSYIEMPLALHISNQSYEKNLAIPENSNPQLMAKAKKLRDKYTNNNEGNTALINEVLTTFTNDVYRYTLSPPRLQNNSLDQFYFDTKAGFCEHFASSFTFLMRASGVPARLVTGYLGGEYNSQGDYHSIYQRDAHAWSEVWLKGKGWTRVDPTAFINPERVEKGFSEQLLREQAASSDTFSLLRFSYNNALINSLRLQLQALDYNWTRWVIGYTADKQNLFLEKLASWLKSLKYIEFITLLKASLLLICSFIVGWGMRKLITVRKPRNIRYYYQQVLLKLNEQGIEKPIEMTPKDFILVINKELPSLAHEFAKFTELYSSLEYQPLNEPQKETVTKAFKQSYKKINIQL